MSKLPEKLIESLKGVEGFDEAAFKAVHESGATVTSVRLNPAKGVALDILQSSEPVPWCEHGRYLPARPSFTFDPSFHAGAYYVQEASSMFLDHIIKQLYPVDYPSTVLDLCAAPGGKSTLLAGRLNESFIISNEVIKSRVTILAENISKWGSSNVIVTHNDPKDFQKLAGFFDLTVVDAPCSGSGLFRKDEDAIDEWSEANVQLCSQRQERILADAIPSLKQNGYLIYSTCSYSKEEDEDICDWIIERLNLIPISIAIDKEWGIVETMSAKHGAPGYRFYPDRVKGEGFFVACFKQANEVEDYYNSHPLLPPITRLEKEIVSPFVDDVDNHSFFKQKDTIIAFPRKFEKDVATAQRTLNVRKSGVAIGVIKGKDLIPHHELALSSIYSRSIPFTELNLENAICYLKRLDLSVNIEGKGWMLMRYKTLNLGWVKVLPSRLNNYYPTDWRILKH